MRSEFVAVLDAIVLYADRRDTLLNCAPEWAALICTGIADADEPCWLTVAPSIVPNAVVGTVGHRQIQTEAAPQWWRELAADRKGQVR